MMTTQSISSIPQNETMFNDAILFVLDHEGGYVNDPRDPGEATNMGISLRFLRSEYPEIGDIDKDGDVDADDIAALTKQQVIAIYKEYFWDSNRLDRLPKKLAIAVFDTAVNCGRVTAVRILQQAISEFADIKVDGILGPITLSLTRSANQDVLLQTFILKRIEYYDKIYRRNKSLGRFYAGWMNRVCDLLEYLK